MDWDLKNSDTLTLQGDLYRGSIGESIAVAFDPTVFPAIVQKHGEHSGGNLLGRWRHSLKDESDLQLQLYYDGTGKRQVTIRGCAALFCFRLQLTEHADVNLNRSESRFS